MIAASAPNNHSSQLYSKPFFYQFSSLTKMKLLNTTALFALTFLTQHVSAGTISQRTTEVLYRGVSS
jgi:hypothetical protein